MSFLMCFSGSLQGYIIMKYYCLVFASIILLSNNLSALPHSHDLSSTVPTVPSSQSHNEETLWTCSMHPQIRSDKPGKCPICSMDLIPLDTYNDTNESRLQVKLSETAQKLAEIETSKVVREAAFAEIELSGKLETDETTSAKIVAHFPGRIEKLYADFTGMKVAKGMHLAEIFGSDVYLNQREILLASNQILKAEESKNNQQINEAKLLYDSVMNKMRVLGYTNQEIDDIIKNGKISDTFTLYSPTDGVIINKNVINGQYFAKGETLFEISNLNKLWLIADAYELDLPFLKYGQLVDFKIAAVPGKIFKGRVIYIDPILDSSTRATKVRVIVDNEEGLLKPGMYLTATVYSQLDANGIAKIESLKEKWISPMHPQIIKDGPGRCDICGIELVPAEKFIKNSNVNNELPLVIPATAPLITGKKAVVYVEKGLGVYEPKTIVLGPKVGNKYIVVSGLNEGENVVTKGNFKIDSELQIKVSNEGMLKLLDENVKNMKINLKPVNEEKENTVIIAVSAFYFDIQKTLSDDNLSASLKSYSLFKLYLNNLTTLQKSDFNKITSVDLSKILKIISALNEKSDIDTAREKFSNLTTALSPFLIHLNHFSKLYSFKFSCSMAFDGKGAYWFQDTKEIANPYFGISMRTCGTEESE